MFFKSQLSKAFTLISSALVIPQKKLVKAYTISSFIFIFLIFWDTAWMHEFCNKIAVVLISFETTT